MTTSNSCTVKSGCGEGKGQSHSNNELALWWWCRELSVFSAYTLKNFTLCNRTALLETSQEPSAEIQCFGLAVDIMVEVSIDEELFEAGHEVCHYMRSTTIQKLLRRALH